MPESRVSDAPVLDISIRLEFRSSDLVATADLLRTIWWDGNCICWCVIGFNRHDLAGSRKSPGVLRRYYRLAGLQYFSDTVLLVLCAFVIGISEASGGVNHSPQNAPRTPRSLGHNQTSPKR